MIGKDSSILDGGFWNGDFGMGILDWGFWIGDFGIQLFINYSENLKLS